MINVGQKLKKEMEAVIALTLYFLAWLVFLMLLKYLLLSNYHIEVSDMSKAFIGALVLAKVVLVLEYVPLGRWIRSRPAYVMFCCVRSCTRPACLL